ncbi:glutaminase [Rothia sp. HC945]|uniref:glutaminase n=1 Tax=Rothia sp. HC945 TaxID=3171170 RepID=UPI003F1ED9C8
MKSPVRKYLHQLFNDTTAMDGGNLADYIPELAKADPEVFSIALTTIDGRTYSVGDDEREFTIQSISKPFAYASALTDRGLEAISAKVGVEPTGEAFNELSLEKGTNRPKNPMINAGAITIHSMLAEPDSSLEDRANHTVEFFSRLAGRKLEMDESVFRSELETADRNFALAHMLRNLGVFEEHAHQVVAGYVAQCAIKVNVRDLAVMGATLANRGMHPFTGERVASRDVARQVLAVMVSAGMYDASGTWFSDVGIPAKSGVSGGILGVLPGQVGIGVFSPRLDPKGNSVRGVNVFNKLSQDMGLHLLNAGIFGSNTIRSVSEGDDETVMRLQGVIQFSGAEAILHRMASLECDPGTMVFDLTKVTRLDAMARRMFLEGLRRLTADGHRVELIDPDEVLPDPDLGGKRYPIQRETP